MKLAILLGTRPEIIKLSPLIRKMSDHDILIHTNQHYSYKMDEIFFKELRLRNPDYNLGVGSKSHAEQTGEMLSKIEKILIQEKPDVVAVQGDTNSCLSAALTAAKLNIKVAHIEAGLRCGDWSMPEEKNRIIVDHISDFLFSPTLRSTERLLSEGIDANKIFYVGNTIVDATIENMKLLTNRKSEHDNFLLLTLHRAENVDCQSRLNHLVGEINKVSEKHTIIFPIHPRTQKMLRQFNIKLSDKIKIIEPVGYLDCLNLELHSNLILTDSGGIQEEACILKKPCVTLRTNTERQETISAGYNILMSNNLQKDIDHILNAKIIWKNLFGRNVSKKILHILHLKSP